MKIGELLREYRIKKNLSSKQVGESINLSAQAICQYERGDRSIKPEILDQLINLLEISPEDLARVNVNSPNKEGNADKSNIDKNIIDEYMGSHFIDEKVNITNNTDFESLESKSPELVIVDLYENVFKDLGYIITLNYDVKNKIYKMYLEELSSNSTKSISLEDFFNLRSNLKEFLDYKFFNINRK